MFVATCPLGIEDLVQDELQALGAQDLVRAPGAVHFQGPEEAALRALLWARLPSRILVILAKICATDRQALHQRAKALPWHTWLNPEGTLSVHCVRGEGALAHSRFAALVLKDAIVDALREATGGRPSIDPQQADARIVLLLKHGIGTICFDLSGESLHRRGYREGGGSAPLKENVAAAVLLRSGWPKKAQPGDTLFDPLCGSGTLLIEGALMALGVPANGHRPRFGADGFLALDQALWQRLKNEAGRQRAKALANQSNYLFLGHDISEQQLRVAIRQADKAQVGHLIAFAQQDVARLELPEPHKKGGFVVTNPPYGARLGGTLANVRALMETLGARLTPLQAFSHHVLVADAQMGFATGMRANKQHRIMHGPLPCTLLHLQGCQSGRLTGFAGAPAPSPRATTDDPLTNRLKKNLRALLPHLKECRISCYRLYDQDLPDYAVAIDIYTDIDTQLAHAHVQEYAAPKEVPTHVAQGRLRHVLSAIRLVMGIPIERMALKERRRQRPEQRYRPGEGFSARRPCGRAKDGVSQGFWVEEDGLHFWVDLHTYLDSGLFLDHRKVRAWVRKHAEGRRFLNLFGYTASVSVAAAVGGARQVATVDMSATYLNWADHNFRGNEMQHMADDLIHADCLAWLPRVPEQSFDLAFVNPPTHSNSKRMKKDFDLARDHGDLLRQTMRTVTQQGMLLFTTHAKKLRLDPGLLQAYRVSELTDAMLPRDFARAKAGCRAWLMRHP